MRAGAARVLSLLRASLFAAFCLGRGAALLRALSRRWFRGAVRVLYCHDLAPPDYAEIVNGAPRRRLNAAELERRLVHIKRHYGFVSLPQALARWRRETEARDLPVLLTFDDGYRSFLEQVYPILKRHQIPVVLLVTSGAVGSRGLWTDIAREIIETSPWLQLTLPLSRRRLSLQSPAARVAAADAFIAELKRVADHRRRQVLRDLTRAAPGPARQRRMLTWDELRALARDPLVAIGSHTITHPILSRLPEHEAHAEIVGARQEIERQLGVRVTVMGYPNGGEEDFTPAHQSIAAEAGFSAAFTTLGGLAIPGCNLFAVPRSCLAQEPWPRFVLRIAGLDDCLALARRALRRFWQLRVKRTKPRAAAETRLPAPATQAREQ